MSAGEAGVLLIVQELWPDIASRDKWPHMRKTFLDGNMVRADAILLKSVILYSAYACFNSG